ncbi:hypothetical protein I7X43_01220 [Inhella sp. 4Y17]|uniref:Uncharacterized protein n=1 Tax=Inhella gelatinilytica TaxID=2795030 RepID=A0A931ISR0_9BURK|nr:hypothetical protein [Inhella gelatinilytica]
MGELTQLSWTQTEGPAVSMQSARSQLIAFEPPQTGRYGFRVQFVDAGGQPQSQSVNVDVAGAFPTPLISPRTSQAVRMGGKVSLRAWPSPGVGASQISWTQLEGPVVTLDTQDPTVAFFTAPTVTRDTVIRLRVTATSQGRSDSADVTVLVERHAQATTGDASALWEGYHVSRVYPYIASSPHAAHLVPCTYAANQRDTSLCSLERLPLLAQETLGQPPAIDQVMNRVLVSHDWMGVNFRRFLETHDTRGDFRRMLMSTTAVVIGAQVRPSFYYAATGAIYLDADNFWLTPEERDTINEAPDYRGAFGKTLQYDMLWRYTIGNASIYSYYAPDQRVTRPIGDLLADAGPLMYHELGHALDFTPPAAYAGLDRSKTLWDNIAPRYGAKQLTSDRAGSLHPLISTELQGLGQVKFHGVTASALQNSYTPSQIAGFFAPDLATDEYAYSTSREDTAMTFEEVLLTRRLGYRRDVAVTPAIQAGDTSRTILVTWGQRGRIGDPRLHPRARLVMNDLAPWFDTTELGQLPAPTPMRAGESWYSNLFLGSEPLRKPFAAGGPLPTKEEWGVFQKELKRRHHARHEGRPTLDRHVH